jgi:hypothetical protein
MKTLNKSVIALSLAGLLSACGPHCSSTQIINVSPSGGGGEGGSGSGHAGGSSAPQEAASKSNAKDSCNAQMSFSNSALPKILKSPTSGALNAESAGKWIASVRAIPSRLVLAWKLFALNRALAGKSDAELDMVFKNAELTSMTAGDKGASEFAKAVQSLRIVKGPNRTLFLELDTKKSGKIVATADTSWRRACDLIEKSIPTSQELSYEVINVATGKSAKVRHPFGGGACSKERLLNYSVFNFEEGDIRAGEEEMPAITLIFEKNVPRPQAWAFFRREGTREQRAFYEKLRVVFKDAIGATESLAMAQR